MNIRDTVVKGGVRLEKVMQVAVRFLARWKQLAQVAQTRVSLGNKADEVEFPADLGPGPEPRSAAWSIFDRVEEDQVGAKWGGLSRPLIRREMTTAVPGSATITWMRTKQQLGQNRDLTMFVVWNETFAKPDGLDCKKKLTHSNKSGIR